MTIYRKATYNDAASLAEIYNYYILNTTATCDTEIKNAVERKLWLDAHTGKYPVLVCEDSGRQIIGFASLSRWSERQAYEDTAEISIYMRNDFTGKGFGKILFEKIIEEGKKCGLHTLVSRITTENELSVKLHEQFGFKMIGTMKECGKKFGKLLDVHLMQLIYS
ncbi:MAG: GNAT family N-acetyltransferase [Bacteroidia bacterium]